jgi:flagellar basal-body rod protein FlgB
MSFNLDKTFSLPAAALQLRAQRTKLIAENLAQADTPNYKARDVDFKSALQQAQGRQSTLRTTQPNHIQPAGGGPLDPPVRYRVPFSAALDGNTVESQAEQAKFAENSVNYQATLTLLGARIQSLMGAIRGE